MHVSRKPQLLSGDDAVEDGFYVRALFRFTMPVEVVSSSLARHRLPFLQFLAIRVR